MSLRTPADNDKKGREENGCMLDQKAETVGNYEKRNQGKTRWVKRISWYRML